MGMNISGVTEAAKTLKKVKEIDYQTADKTDENLYVKGEGVYTCYRYFSKGELEDTLEIQNATRDVIINFQTREVISVEGQTCKGRTYYRLQDIAT